MPALSLATVVLLSGVAPALPAGCDGAGNGEVVAQFTAALLARDAEALAALLPHELALRLTTTIEEPWLSEEVPARRAAAELADGTGIHALLIDGGASDDLADWIEGFAAQGWIEPEPGRFQPENGDGRTFLRLRCEGGRPVVVEIAWPAA